MQFGPLFQKEEAANTNKIIFKQTLDSNNAFTNQVNFSSVGQQLGLPMAVLQAVPLQHLLLNGV